MLLRASRPESLRRHVLAPLASHSLVQGMRTTGSNLSLTPLCYLTVIADRNSRCLVKTVGARLARCYFRMSVNIEVPTTKMEGNIFSRNNSEEHTSRRSSDRGYHEFKARNYFYYLTLNLNIAIGAPDRKPST